MAATEPADTENLVEWGGGAAAPEMGSQAQSQTQSARDRPEDEGCGLYKRPQSAVGRMNIRSDRAAMA